MELQDRTAIVTGAGSGVGRALALAFAQAGMFVVCAARRETEIAKTVQLLEAAGGRGLAVPTDITNPQAVDNLIARTLDARGRLDMLFNNAGRFNCLGAVWEVDPADWWQDVTVNLLGTMLCARAALGPMRQQNAGVIINMRGGDRIPGGTGYSCSKTAIPRFTELLAKELEVDGSAVLCFAMGPGFVRTEMTEKQITTDAGRKWLPSSAEAVAAKRDRPPEDCARTAVELLKLAHPKMAGRQFGAGQDLAALRTELGI